MREFDQKAVAVFYTAIGVLLGFLVFMFPLGGWEFLFLGRSSTVWQGLLGLIVCLPVGGCLGFFTHKFSHVEFGNTFFGHLFQNQAEAVVFSKRVMTIAGSLVVFYFIWQLAKEVL